MNKILTIICGVVLGAVLGIIAAILSVLVAPAAHADEGLPCPYPFTGTVVEVKVGVEAGGKFCDGPTEINGSHFHCAVGGANVGGGGVGLAPINGITFGGIASGGFGGGGGECFWACPDSTRTVQPNPPGAWKDYLVVRPGNNSCQGHMTPAGPTSEVVEPDQGPPGFQNPMLLPPELKADPPEEPVVPTVTNPVRGNPEALS